MLISSKCSSRRENTRHLRPAKRREFLPLPLVILIKATIGHTDGELIVFGPEVKR
jgi:hypothetical protein